MQRDKYFFVIFKTKIAWIIYSLLLIFISCHRKNDSNIIRGNNSPLPAPRLLMLAWTHLGRARLERTQTHLLTSLGLSLTTPLSHWPATFASLWVASPRNQCHLCKLSCNCCHWCHLTHKPTYFLLSFLQWRI